jgi:hypothetical protein
MALSNSTELPITETLRDNAAVADGPYRLELKSAVIGTCRNGSYRRVSCRERH